MLEATLQQQLKGHLERLVHPIELVASLDDSAKSREMAALLETLASLSPKVSLRLDGNATRRPGFGVACAGEVPRVHFSGLPLGHEFTSLVLALLQVGGHPPRLGAAQIDRIKALPGEAASQRLEVFVGLSCHNCPDVVQAVNTLAALNPAFVSEMIDGAMFQEEVDARQIMGVPALFLNGEPLGQGRMTMDDLLASLDSGSETHEAEVLAEKPVFDVLVVGGGPAGAAAAIYAARKGVRTGIVTERFGGQVLDTLAIENFISVSATEGPKLVAALETHVRDYDVDIVTRQEVVALEPPAGRVPAAVTLASGAVLKANSIILATGARWRELGVPGEKKLRGRGVAYCPHCDGPLFKGKRVAVVGGGNSGVEAAIDLAGIVAEVTLLEYGETLRADAVLQARLRGLENVRIITEAQTTEVTGEDKVDGLTYTDRATGESHRLELEGLFVQIGLLPNSDWLRDTLSLSRHGEIDIDARGATSVPGVFAAGDVTTVPYKQIIISMGEGAKAALSAFDYLIRQETADET